jgi:hypothetical protein
MGLMETHRNAVLILDEINGARWKLLKIRTLTRFLSDPNNRRKLNGAKSVRSVGHHRHCVDIGELRHTEPPKQNGRFVPEAPVPKPKS